MGFARFPFGDLKYEDFPKGPHDLTKPVHNSVKRDWMVGDTVWVYFERFQYAARCSILEIYTDSASVYVLDNDTPYNLCLQNRQASVHMAELFDSEEDLLSALFGILPSSSHVTVQEG